MLAWQCCYTLSKTGGRIRSDTIFHLDSDSHNGPQPCPSVYRLRPGSPALEVGANLAATPYNLDIGTRDYFGNTLGTSINIGGDGGKHPRRQDGHVRRRRGARRAVPAHLVGGRTRGCRCGDCHASRLMHEAMPIGSSCKGHRSSLPCLKRSCSGLGSAGTTFRSRWG